MSHPSPSPTVTDDLDLLLGVLPDRVRRALRDEPGLDELLEVVLDLGRTPEARYAGRTIDIAGGPVSREELGDVVDRVARFGADNRAGIERTLHRISALRNREGGVVGLTCRVGRAVLGTVDIVRDVIESGVSTLLLGRPGVGKTTLLREAARVLADDLGKRVVVVDTSNEIAGDGDIPHPGIGHARRMQVPTPDRQHAVMIEAVENHMPEVIVIDEIGTAAEAVASRTIAERGVQLIATAHGNTLVNLLQNPTLSDLIGGIQVVTLSDEEARRRGTQKSVLERKAPPTFDVVIEIRDKDSFAVHSSVDRTVDGYLRGAELAPEVRRRTPDGGVEVQDPEDAPAGPRRHEASGTSPWVPSQPPRRFTSGRPLRIFPYAVSRSRLERAIRDTGSPARLVGQLAEADVVLTLKAQERRQPKRLLDAQMRGLRLEVVRSNTIQQLTNFLRDEFGLPDRGEERRTALREAEAAVDAVRERGIPVELQPRDRGARRLQHELVERHGLATTSRGQEPFRRVVVQP